MNAPFRHDAIVVSLWDALTADQTDRVDRFIAAHPRGTIFHRPAWIRSVAEACDQDWRFLIAEGPDQDIQAMLPFNLIHSPLFGRALVSSGFAVGGGVLSVNEAAELRLADEAIIFAERNSFPSIELRGGSLPATGWTVKSDVYAGFEGALAGNDDDQLLAIPRKQRAEVRKGLKNGLTVRVGRGDRDRDDHYAVYSESVRNLGTPVFPRDLFNQTLDAFPDASDILTVLKDDKPLASVQSFYDRGAVMPYWGGGIWDARRFRANDIMYYALMNHARQRGCTRFDFGRSKLGTGAYAFKKNWGFDPKPLSYAEWALAGSAGRDVNPLSPKYRAQVALWQRLPLAIANKVGPMIAKGLG